MSARYQLRSQSSAQAADLQDVHASNQNVDKIQLMNRTQQGESLKECYQRLLFQIDTLFDEILDDETFPQSVVVKTFTWLENLSDSLAAWAGDIEAEKPDLAKLDNTSIGQSLRERFEEISEGLSDGKNLLTAFNSKSAGSSAADGDNGSAAAIPDHNADITLAAGALFQLQELVDPIRKIFALKYGTGRDSLLSEKIHAVYVGHQQTLASMERSKKESKFTLAQGQTEKAKTEVEMQDEKEADFDKILVGEQNSGSPLPGWDDPEPWRTLTFQSLFDLSSTASAQSSPVGGEKVPFTQTSRKTYMHPPYIVIEPNDDKDTVKRKRNAGAARLSRERKKDQLSAMSSEISRIQHNIRLLGGSPDEDYSI